MTPSTLLVAFFLFTLAAVSAAGYAFVLKPSRSRAEGGSAGQLLVCGFVLENPASPAAHHGRVRRKARRHPIDNGAVAEAPGIVAVSSRRWFDSASYHALRQPGERESRMPCLNLSDGCAP